MLPRAIFALMLLLLMVPADAIDGVTVTYSVDTTDYAGYYISPVPKAPLVILVHDWDGLTEYEVTRAGMLTKLGYAVFAVDLFGKGVRPTTVNEKKQLTGELYADRNRMRRLLNAGLAAAKAQGGNLGNAVIIGYCFGGSAVLELARSGATLKGFVTFHGGLSTPDDQNYAAVKGSILVFHGSADTSVSLNDFAALATALEEAGIPHEMTTYSGAPHAFTVFDTDRYRADADRKSWQRFTEYLAETLH